MCAAGLWRYLADQHAAFWHFNNTVNQVAVTCKWQTGFRCDSEVWERNPPKMCHTSVLGFKVSNSATIQFGCNLKSNDVTIYLHRATARWASEWQMIKRVMIRSFTTAGRSKQATPLGLLMKPQQSLGTDWNESVSKPVSCLFQSITFNSIYPSIILPSLYMMVPLSSAGAVMQHKRQRIHPGQALVYRN